MYQVVFQVFVIIVAVELLVIVLAYGLWIYLHAVLSKRLDPILLKEPYFTKSEQMNCLVWPLSFIKSLNYIGLIAAPKVAKRKRFRGFNQELPLSPQLKRLCRIQFTLMLMLVVVGVTFFGYMGIALAII